MMKGYIDRKDTVSFELYSETYFVGKLESLSSITRCSINL